MNLILIVTLIAAWSGRLLLNVRLPYEWGIPSEIVNAMNGIATSILIFLMTYSFKTLLDVIINVFNFTQYINHQLSCVENGNEGKEGTRTNESVIRQFPHKVRLWLYGILRV